MKRTAKFLLAFLATITVLLVGTIGFAYFYFQQGYRSVSEEDRQSVKGLAPGNSIAAPLPNELRKPSNAYLSVPEWFIVFISDDYAQAISKEPPSAFAYGEYLKDYWRLYGRLAAEIEGVYPTDSEYHTMVRVIGISTTIEFGLKAAYEGTVGRTFEWFSGYSTAEDEYAAKVAADYVNFIRLRPWYEYDFHKALVNCWAEVPQHGPSRLRKYERRTILSIEYALKWGYASLIEWATHEAYGVADVDTYVRLLGDRGQLADLDSRINVVGGEHGAVYAVIPRYHPFTEIAPKITAVGGVFRTISGHSFVTVGVIASSGFKAEKDVYVLAASPVHLPDAGGGPRTRLLYLLPVEKLGSLLDAVQKSNGTLEHIYDF